MLQLPELGITWQRTVSNSLYLFFFFTIPFDQYEFVRVRKYLKHTIPIHILLGEFPKTGSLYLISFIMENFSLLLVSQIYTVSERY